MKEIKLRAWDGELFLYLDINNVEDDILMDYLIYFFKLPKQEHTGLKDIYQNDIVECPDGWTGKVWWNDEELQWWAKDHDLAGLNNPKVIGNIYENKELLDV